MPIVSEHGCIFVGQIIFFALSFVGQPHVLLLHRVLCEVVNVRAFLTVQWYDANFGYFDGPCLWQGVTYTLKFVAWVVSKVKKEATVVRGRVKHHLLKYSDRCRNRFGIIVTRLRDWWNFTTHLFCLFKLRKMLQKAHRLRFKKGDQFGVAGAAIFLFLLFLHLFWIRLCKQLCTFLSCFLTLDSRRLVRMMLRVIRGFRFVAIYILSRGTNEMARRFEIAYEGHP